MKTIHYIILLSLVLFSCKKEETTETEPTANESGYAVSHEQFKAMNMEFGSLTEHDFYVSVQATGVIDVPPQNKAKVTTFLGGYVKTTNLLVGDKVKKGEALLTLENTDFVDIQKDYLEVAEQIGYLKSEYERQKTLYDEKITSQKNYLKAESDYKKTLGMYQSLKKKLQLLNISPAQVEKGNLTSVITLYAPITGDVTQMNANVGMFMSPSDIILEIVDIEHLHVELNVFEKDILKIKEKQNIVFTVPQASKEKFNAEVVLVGKSIENKDRTIMVHGHLDDNIKQRLLTGMFVEAKIETESIKGLGIPTEAILSENNKNFVFLLDKDQNGSYSFKKVLVKTGEQTDTFTQILPESNLPANAKILIKGAFDIN